MSAFTSMPSSSLLNACCAACVVEARRWQSKPAESRTNNNPKKYLRSALMGHLCHYTLETPAGTSRSWTTFER